MLKVDYIDVNLNNSRKLMGNINRLGETTDHTVDSHQELVDALTPLEVISHELAWLNPESQPRVSPSPASAAASTAGKTLSDGLL